MVFNQTISYGLLVLLLLAVVAGIFFSSKIKQAYADWRLLQTVRKLGHEVMQNIILSDGIDGTVYIDNLVLMPDKIMIVSVGRYQGAVFASENIDVWTQVVGQRSYKFSNPLLKLEQDVAAVRAHLPKTDITGILIFSADVAFPKGKPDNVISMDEAKQRFAGAHDKQVTAELLVAWKEIKSKIQSEA